MTIEGPGLPLHEKRLPRPRCSETWGGFFSPAEGGGDGLTYRETRDLLGQLADETGQNDRQLATLEGRLQVTQAQFVALLDIQATPTPDGFLIGGSIPPLSPSIPLRASGRHRQRPLGTFVET